MSGVKWSGVEWSEVEWSGVVCVRGGVSGRLSNLKDVCEMLRVLST